MFLLEIQMEKGKIFPDDVVLAQRIREGDLSAFTGLYEKYHTYLYLYSIKFIASPEIAEEAVHDVLLKVWENRKSLDPGQSLKAYLTRICKNHLLNVLRSRLREKIRESEAYALKPSWHNDTEDYVFSSDYERLLKEAIAQLSPQRQKIFNMYRIEGKKLDEIAHDLHISKGTVKDHILKTTRQLKDFVRVHAGIPTDSILLIWFFLNCGWF